MRRLFSVDPEMGITRWFHYDEGNGQVTIHTEQNLDKLVALNHFAQKEQTSLSRWGDGKIAATIPLSLYLKFREEGKDKDQSFMRRWLNDPENRMYRRFLGRI